MGLGITCSLTAITAQLASGRKPNPLRHSRCTSPSEQSVANEPLGMGQGLLRRLWAGPIVVRTSYNRSIIEQMAFAARGGGGHGQRCRACVKPGHIRRETGDRRKGQG